MKRLCSSRWLLAVCFVTIGALRAAGETRKLPDLPPQVVIDAAFQGPEPPVQVSAEKPVGSEPDPLCGLTPADLHVTRGNKTRTYKMLVEAPDKEPFSPTKVFLRVSRLTVDADGSSRAYHPDDPLGVGVCTPGKSNACALDELPNADVALLKGTKNVEHDTAEDRADYQTTWSKAWPLIAANPTASLNHKTDPRIPEDYTLYYFKNDDLTVAFKTTIIPFHDGAPCIRSPKDGDAGYFVAATSFTKGKVKPQTMCDPSHYVDASKVPFVVVPGDTFGAVKTGDIAVGFAPSAPGNPVVFGIVADKGPPFKLAEASIAFNSKILGRNTPLINSTEQKKIDIDLPQDQITAMGVLILGGTAATLEGNFSAKHIAAVGARLLKRWSLKRDPKDRLADCLRAAPVNPWKEE